MDRGRRCRSGRSGCSLRKSARGFSFPIKDSSGHAETQNIPRVLGISLCAGARDQAVAGFRNAFALSGPRPDKGDQSRGAGGCGRPRESGVMFTSPGDACFSMRQTGSGISAPGAQTRSSLRNIPAFGYPFRPCPRQNLLADFSTLVVEMGPEKTRRLNQMHQRLMSL